MIKATKGQRFNSAILQLYNFGCRGIVSYHFIIPSVSQTIIIFVLTIVNQFQNSVVECLVR